MKHLFYLNKFFLRYKILLLSGAIFITIANLFALYPAEFVREAFDKILENINNNNGDLDKIKKTILFYSGLIFVFAALKGVFMYLMRQTIIVMSRKIEHDLKNEIYYKYQTLSLATRYSFCSIFSRSMK